MFWFMEVIMAIIFMMHGDADDALDDGDGFIIKPANRILAQDTSGSPREGRTAEVVLILGEECLSPEGIIFT